MENLVRIYTVPNVAEAAADMLGNATVLYGYGVYEGDIEEAGILEVVGPDNYIDLSVSIARDIASRFGENEILVTRQFVESESIATAPMPVA